MYQNPFAELEQYAEDLMYQKAGTVPNNIKIIAIDERTLSDLGPYNEWDRNYFADLIEAVYADGYSPKVMAFDIIFSGTNESEGDVRLASVAGLYDNIICATKLETSSRVIRRSGNVYSESYVSAVTGAYDALYENTIGGFVTPIFDSDGYTRRAYSSLNYNGAEYVSFALQVARLAGYDGSLPVVYEFQYSGNPGDYEIIPMSYVLSGKVKASYFKDAIVLVGACEEAMMDSYSVPIDHSKNMYGVEIQANEINAILNNLITSKASMNITIPVLLLMLLIAGMIIIRTDDVRIDLLTTVASIVVYIFICWLGITVFKIKLPIVYFPISILSLFITDLIIEYIISQKSRVEEMHKILFSMADSMAEAIEGRTPYNANHTKNVAKRSVEMLDYINKLHKQKKTELHFTKNDRKQLYLAAMLHDIGKMDVPTNIMDKPTRLGNRYQALSDRLKLISLYLKVDELEGRKSADAANREIADIEKFLSQLDSYNSGRPLKEDELTFIDDIAGRVYEGEEKIPYLTEEEIADLHIKAGTLSDSEREKMQSHVVYTDRILSHIDFGKEFDRVRRMAADHHELINGAGYPMGKKAEDLDVLTRILTIMDIFDSLIADDRPYKKAKSIPVAFSILDEEAEKGKVDKELVAIAKELYLKEG